MAGHRWNPNNHRKIFQPKRPVAVMPELPGRDCVKSTGMSMSGEPQGAVVLLHEFEMGPELLPPGIETFDNSGKIGAGIVAQHDTILRGGEDRIGWEAGQESDLLFTISRIQVLFMRPLFIPGPVRPIRDLSGGMQIVVSRDNDLALLPNQIQAGMCVPGFGVAVVRFTES